MQKEDWHEYLGRVIGGTVTLGVGLAIGGLVWGLAVGFGMVTGAKWGGIIGSSIGFILSLLLGRRKYAAGGIGMMFINSCLVATVIGLVVWLVRTLVG